MEQYHELLKGVLGSGDVEFEPRTQSYTIGKSAWLSVYDLRDGFPLVTTKNVLPRFPFEELFWKLRGESNIKSLVNKKIHIWTANAFDRYLRINNLEEDFPKHSQEWEDEYEEYINHMKEDIEFADLAGELGPVYGHQWRHWKDSKGREIDQLTNLIKGVKKFPGSRYNLLSSWNVGDLDEMAIGPCPFWHQVSVYGDVLDLTAVQRSCDIYLGVPFNIAQDSLLTHMIAEETGLEPRFFNHQYINSHVYLGILPRAGFWTNEKNVKEFQGRLNEIEERSEYLDLKNWYLNKAPEEFSKDRKKDHTPFILEQLSKEPRPLPKISFREGFSLLDAIYSDPLEVVDINGYDPERWESKAYMAV